MKKKDEFINSEDVQNEDTSVSDKENITEKTTEETEVDTNDNMADESDPISLLIAQYD